MICPASLYFCKFENDIRDRALRSVTIMAGPGDYGGWITTDVVRDALIPPPSNDPVDAVIQRMILRRTD